MQAGGGVARGKLAYRKTHNYCGGIHRKEVYEFNFELAIVLFLETQIAGPLSKHWQRDLQETHVSLCSWCPTQAQEWQGQDRGNIIEGPRLEVIPKELSQAEGTRH